MINEFYERFLELERREHLMHRTVGGVRYWHLARFYIYTRSVLGKIIKLDVPHPDLVPAEEEPRRPFLRRVVGKLRRWMTDILAVTIHNPALAFCRCGVLFSLTPRQTDFGDGRKVSVLLDFFSPQLKSRAALLEIVLPPGPTRQPCGRRVLWLRESHRRFDKCRRCGEFARTAAERQREAEEVARKLSEEFEIAITADEIAAHIDYALLTREAYLPLFRKLLRRLSPKVVVTAVQYYTPNFILTEAAHELGIPVVELQHGTVFPAHVAYNLPENGSVYSPEIFLAWGRHWAEQMRNYPRERMLLSGFPYFDHCRNLYPPCPRKAGGPFRILFVSQGTVARKLVSFATELRALLPVDRFTIIYKLHPNESRTWRVRYPSLMSAGVEVVENLSRNIYTCLRDADVAVGLNSTALVEGFAWGVRAFVFRQLPGSETMEDFCRSGTVEFVDSVERLAERLKQIAANPALAGKSSFDVSRFWVPNAAKNIASVIDALASGNCPSGLNML